MLDIKWIRENYEQFDKLMIKRKVDVNYSSILQLDEEKRNLITVIQKLQNARNATSKSLGMIKDHASSEFINLKNEVLSINTQLEDLNYKLAKNEDILIKILDQLPNIVESDVPEGSDENDNLLIRKWNASYINNNSKKQHFEIAEDLKMLDFEVTAKMSGSRFATLKADLAKLERALSNFMLDMHTQEFGYTEISPPYLVHPKAMYNVGQLPKFDQDSFETREGYRLIPTSEVSLVNLVADSIISREELPIRYTAYTPCFRSEAGSSGRDTKGMFRMHQFSKVELVSITTPEESKNEHERITNIAEEVLRRLDLSYQVMLLCAGDMGFHSQKTYDIEVWMPVQQKYREISSCSNCGDYQARRMKARYKEFGDKNTTLVHTLNGSALAVGRCIIAILENYQNEDGSITIPDILREYMGGKTKIDAIQL